MAISNTFLDWHPTTQGQAESRSEREDTGIPEVCKCSVLREPDKRAIHREQQTKTDSVQLVKRRPEPKCKCSSAEKQTLGDRPLQIQVWSRPHVLGAFSSAQTCCKHEQIQVQLRREGNPCIPSVRCLPKLQLRRLHVLPQSALEGWISRPNHRLLRYLCWRVPPVLINKAI